MLTKRLFGFMAIGLAASCAPETGPFVAGDEQADSLDGSKPSGVEFLVKFECPAEADEAVVFYNDSLGLNHGWHEVFECDLGRGWFESGPFEHTVYLVARTKLGEDIAQSETQVFGAGAEHGDEIELYFTFPQD